MNEPSIHSDRRRFLKALGAASAGLVLGSSLSSSSFAAEAPAAGIVPRRKFGRHDDMVSAIAIGGHALATAPTVEEATRIAHAALDRGINFFDNAWDYHDGRGEQWMGVALKGKRDKAFLMTKVCTHRNGNEQAMKMLEDSLTRLQTDHLDLWQMHELGKESHIENAYIPGGTVEIMQKAQKEGKVRYIGFTGHLNPDLHLKMLSHGFPFDSVQMPLSAFEARDEGFQKKVLPELIKQNIAPIAMKSLGGNGKSVKNGIVTVEEALRYTLSLPVVTVVSGIDSMGHLEQNSNVVANFKPLSVDEMVALESRCVPSDDYRPYRKWGYRDGDAHQKKYYA